MQQESKDVLLANCVQLLALPLQLQFKVHQDLMAQEEQRDMILT